MSATSVWGGAIWWTPRSKGRHWCNCKKTVWSMPEHPECEVLQKERYIKYTYLYLDADCCNLSTTSGRENSCWSLAGYVPFHIGLGLLMAELSQVSVHCLAQQITRRRWWDRTSGQATTIAYFTVRRKLCLLRLSRDQRSSNVEVWRLSKALYLMCHSHRHHHHHHHHHHRHPHSILSHIIRWFTHWWRLSASLTLDFIQLQRIYEIAYVTRVWQATFVDIVLYWVHHNLSKINNFTLMMLTLLYCQFWHLYQ